MAKMPADRVKRWEDVFQTVDPTPKADAEDQKSKPEKAWDSLHHQTIKAVLPITPKKSTRK